MAASAAPGPIVFVGPTLTVEEVTDILPAICLPPASQGTLVRAVRDHSPTAILLIDGTFQGEPAIRHKEILWAMAQGIPVLGAASMGALRAAELWPHGMIGVGLIFRWYRRYPLLPDDAVAVLHGPGELGFRPLTRSLVDLRLTVRAAARRGLIDAATCTRLERAAGLLNFRDRTLANMVEYASGGTGLTALLQQCFVDRKKTDARAALHRLRRLDPGRHRRGAPFRFTTTTAFLRDLRHAGIELP